MVEIYDEKSGDHIAVFPWTKHDIGDFRLYYIFPRIGCELRHIRNLKLEVQD